MVKKLCAVKRRRLSAAEMATRCEGRDDWGVQPDAGLADELTQEVSKQSARQRERQLNGEKIDTPVHDTQLSKAVAFLQLD